MLVDAIPSHCRPIEDLLQGRIATPAIVYDKSRLCALTDIARQVGRQTGVRVLYAVKACAFSDVLQMLAPSLDGFAVSSLFEARLVRELFPSSPIHLTTPGLRECEIEELAEICNFVTFNSETHLKRYGPRIHRYVDVGLRVNTHVSSIEDPRYDPARLHSKLGVPLGSLREILVSAPVTVRGLHFHTNADSQDLSELLANVEALVEAVGGTREFDWVNFGGGYLLGEVEEIEPLEHAVAIAKLYLASEVFLEPGAGLVRAGGYLIASVLDMFDRDNSRVAVLDTSVNHLPEVLEFDYQPEIESSTVDGDYEYILAGSSCLAGDVFGRYRFNSPLTIGAAVVFTEAGAYAQAKSHRFNGINLPGVWVASPDRRLERRQSLDYEAYLQQWMPND